MGLHVGSVFKRFFAEDGSNCSHRFAHSEVVSYAWPWNRLFEAVRVNKDIGNRTVYVSAMFYCQFVIKQNNEL